MKKTTKIIAGVCIGIIAVIVILAVMFTLWWNGAFNKLFVKDVASFEEPSGNYCLYFQQLGDPEWPFGKTDIRLTLKDRNGETINSIDTTIQDDGANAYEGNIKSVEWKNDSVIVILRASEMPDKEIELKYPK